MMTPYLSALILAFVLCLLLTPLAMRLARRLDIMDHPNTALKRHAAPVPYLGGLAIFLSFVAAVFFCRLAFFPPGPGGSWPLGTERLRGVYSIVAGGMAALILGLIDDARALSPKIKFVGQILGALLLVFFGLRVRFVENHALSVVLTVLWVVTVTNAMNFVDIMDGLAAGVGGIAALGFFLFSLHAGRFNDSVPAAALAGSCFAFLVYNFRPAKVYMGDAGSHFIGFALAAISLNLSYSHQNGLAIFSPLLIMALPLFDLALMTYIRLRNGVAPWKGSPDHIPLRLLALGLSKTQAVVLLYAVTALLCVGTYLASFLNRDHALAVWVSAVIVLVLLGSMLASIRMPHDPKKK